MRIGRFARRYSGVRAVMVGEIPAYVEEIARAFQAGYNHAEREADELNDHRQTEPTVPAALPGDNGQLPGQLSILEDVPE